MGVLCLSGGFETISGEVINRLEDRQIAGTVSAPFAVLKSVKVPCRVENKRQVWRGLRANHDIEKFTRSVWTQVGSDN